MDLDELPVEDSPCIVCEKCNVGKVSGKLPIGDRVTHLSKTPLMELLRLLLKEVVTKDMMLCIQCLKCLNRKDKLMVLEKNGQGQALKRQGGRGRGGGRGASRGGRGASRGGRGASRGGRAGASSELEDSSQGGASTRRRKRGGSSKGSASRLDLDEPGGKIPRLDETGDVCSTLPRLDETEAAVQVPSALEATDVPCIMAVKEEVLSDEEREEQTTEIRIDKDTVVATTTPGGPQDPLTLQVGDLYNSDLIKSEITVDGDDCVVGLKCVDERALASATIHVVSSIDDPAPRVSAMPASGDEDPEPSITLVTPSTEACISSYIEASNPHSTLESIFPSTNASITHWAGTSLSSFPVESISSRVSSVPYSKIAPICSSSDQFIPSSLATSSQKSPVVNVTNSLTSPVVASSSTSCLLFDAAASAGIAVPTNVLSTNALTLCKSANFTVTVDAASLANIPFCDVSSQGELNSHTPAISTTDASLFTNFTYSDDATSSSSISPLLGNSVTLPSASEAGQNDSVSNIITFQIGSESAQVVNPICESETGLRQSRVEDETTYIDMPVIFGVSNEEPTDISPSTNMAVTKLSSDSLLPAEDGEWPQTAAISVGASVFPCSLCSSAFKTAGALRHHHEHNHNKLRRRKCFSCPYSACDLEAVEDHMKTEHGIRPQHFCKYCEASFILRGSHQNHLKVVHRLTKSKPYEKATYNVSQNEKKTITCPHCNDVFETNKDLKIHNTQAHDGEMFSCKTCGFKCNSPKTLARHDADKHKTSNEFIYTCTICKSKFNSEVELENHCGNEHNLEKTRSCKKCGVSFITDVMLRSHEATHNTYCCQFCNLGFKKLEFYEAHIKKVHNNEQNLNSRQVLGALDVNLPSQVFSINNEKEGSENIAFVSNALQVSTDTSLAQVAGSGQTQSSGSDGKTLQYDQKVAEDYLKQVRGTPYNQKVPCIFCFKEVTAGHLRTHFKNHSGVTPYACDFCSKVCIQSTNLRKHVRTKHPEHFRSWDSSAKTPKKKSFSCEFCDVVCEGIDEYEVHLWEHMSSKEHECALCKTRFGLENNLKEHMKTHYFETLQTCEHCKRTFKNIGAYNEHVENCKNQWTCPTCGLCLQSENKFRKHMKSTHSGSDVYKYVCTEPGCGRKYFEKHRYDDHCITHESERRYQCPHCHKRFKRLRPMNDHIKCKHNGSRCSACEMLFTSLDQLVQHRIRSHSSEFHECPECGLQFLHDTTLANHTRCHHPDDDVFEVPQCHICDELFSNEAALTTHFTEHHKGSYICCAFGCYSSAACEDDLRDHLSSEHAGLDYECVYCQTDHLDEAALRRHFIESHVKERLCKICASSFYKDELLQRHASQHGDSAKYLCDACDFTCCNRYSMVSHLKNTHYVSSENLMGCVMKQRVYGCSSCDTLTVTLTEMTQHILTHEISNDSEVLAFTLPTKLESDLICCPVCSTPWPNQSTIIQHLQLSKFCAEQLASGDRVTQTQSVEETCADSLSLCRSTEMQVDNETDTSASSDMNIVFVEEGKGVYSSILTSDGKSSGATLVEVNGQQYLAPLSDIVLDGTCSKAAAVVEVDGEHFVVLRESKDDCPEVETSDQQQPRIPNTNQLTTENPVDSLNVFLQSSSTPEEGLSVMLDEEHLSSLFNSSKDVIYAHDM